MSKKVFISFVLTFKLLLGQIIDHVPESNILAGIPLNIELFTDYDKTQISSLSIYYKSHNQDIYVKEKLIGLSSNYYGYVIPSNFLNDKYIEYYFLLELNDGSFISFPQNNPHNSPISVRIDKILNNLQDEIDYLDADYNIISPKSEEKVVNEDLVISLSYFGMSNIDYDNVKVYLDKKDVSDFSQIRTNNIMFIPSNIREGKHNVKIILSTVDGIVYNPIDWSFYVVSEINLRKTLSFSGKVWNDYSNNEIDQLSLATNTTNLTFQVNSDWVDVKGKFKKSSLENHLLQAKDRYSLDIKVNNLFNINIGDFYPNFNRNFINGNRVRGVGFNLKSSLFDVNLISGELARSVQGSQNGGVGISDYYSVYNEINQSDEYYLDISRNEYAFSRDVMALRVGYSKNDRINLAFNLLKSKDDISSVNSILENSIITLPYDMEIFSEFNSDQCIDFNGDSECSVDEPVYLIDYNSNGIYNEWQQLSIDTQYFFSVPELIKLESSIYIADCSDYDENCDEGNSYGLIQYVWDMKISYENLDYLKQIFNIDNVVYTENNWGGAKPKDNIVMGTDFSYASKNNNFRIKSSIALSLYNENIWDGGLTNSQIDGLDGYTDCFIGRTYLMTSEQEACISWDQESCELIVEDTLECSLLVNENFEPLIAESGISIEDFPDLEDYTDFFMFTVDNIPFPSVVDKVKNGETVKFYDIFNSPDIAYDLDFSLKALNQHINFGLKQVGESFYTLGNPYMQKDMNEKYFNNSVRLLKNRLFLILKWNRITNGLLMENQSITEKNNLNISYYPGINLPSFALSIGKSSRESGEISEGWTYGSWSSEGECLDDEGNSIGGITDQDECIAIQDTYDNRQNTASNSFNLSINHNFNFIYDQSISLSFYNSIKKDMLFDDFAYSEEGLLDTSYISPKSKSNNFSLNLRTQYDYKWESHFQFSRSYFDYAQESSTYHQVQRVNSFSSGFVYKTDYLMRRIGGGLDYSSGNGNNRYDQTGIKLFADLEFRHNLNLIINYTYKFKSIVNDTNYNNSLFKANLSYRF